MWLIIGYGNSLREDDGAGYHLAEHLATELPPGAARVLAVHQLTPEHVLDLCAENVQRVVFIDVRRNQDQPVILNRLNPLMASGSCGHQMTPELLLQMTYTLYRRSPKAWLLTLPAHRMKVGETLSSATRCAITLAAGLVANLVSSTTDKSFSMVVKSTEVVKKS